MEGFQGEKAVVDDLGEHHVLDARFGRGRVDSPALARPPRALDCVVSLLVGISEHVDPDGRPLGLVLDPFPDRLGAFRDRRDFLDLAVAGRADLVVMPEGIQRVLALLPPVALPGAVGALADRLAGDGPATVRQGS